MGTSSQLALGLFMASHPCSPPFSPPSNRGSFHHQQPHFRSSARRDHHHHPCRSQRDHLHHFRCLRGHRQWRCSAGAGQDSESRKTVLIVGGAGRVGSSTGRQLRALLPDVELIVTGRDRNKGEAAAKDLDAKFLVADIEKEDLGLSSADLSGLDLIIHTAGPFQRRKSTNVAQAAITLHWAASFLTSEKQRKIPYMDVCDDGDYSQLLKSKYHEKAMESQVPMVTTTGIYPGLSNLMASNIVVKAREKDPDDVCDRIRFSYYTAGSGGVGATILATSFLLCGETVKVFVDGEEVEYPPASTPREVYFGPKIQRKRPLLYNLPEVASIHETLNIPSVSARFATEPPIWNLAMVAVARLFPREMLQDIDKIQPLVRLSMPFVKAVDSIVGERVAIRVDMDTKKGVKATSFYEHRSLSESVGIATAAFAFSMIQGDCKPGMWYPEEEGLTSKEQIVELASRGSARFLENKPEWELSSEPRQLGFGIYID